MENEVGTTHVFIGLVIIALVLLGLFFIDNKSFTGFAVFEQQNQTEFDFGTYDGVEHDGSAIVLSANQTSGTYTSIVFDNGEEVLWDNIVWTGNLASTVSNGLSSATHAGSPVEGLDLNDGNFSTINFSESSLQLDFTNSVGEGAMLNLHAKTNTGSGDVEVQDSSGNVLGSFMVTSDVGEDFSIDLNLTSPLSSLFLTGIGNESLVDFDYVSSENPSTESIGFETRACSTQDCANMSFSSEDTDNLGLTGQYFQYKILFAGTSSSPSVETVSVESFATQVQVTIVKPSETETSPQEVPLQFNVEGKVSSCYYSIEEVPDGLVVLQNTTLVDCGNSSFSLNDEGDYILNLYVETSTDFIHTVYPFLIASEDDDSTSETSSETEETVDESNSQVTPTTPTTPNLELIADDITPVSSSSGDSEVVQLTVVNTGNSHVSACTVSPAGDLASWISSPGDSLNINSGEAGTFSFDVVVPENTELGAYSLSVSLDCSETSVTKEFTLEVTNLESETEGTPTAGFAIFGGNGGTGGFIVFLIVVLALVVVFFTARRMRKTGTSFRDLLRYLKPGRY